MAIPVADRALSSAGEGEPVHGAEMTESRCASNLDAVEDALGESIARRLAAVISRAPGFAGMPSSGQSASAVTRASWSSSSAMPISLVARAMAAVSRVDAIFHAVSIA